MDNQVVCRGIVRNCKLMGHVGGCECAAGKRMGSDPRRRLAMRDQPDRRTRWPSLRQGTQGGVKWYPLRLLVSSTHKTAADILENRKYFRLADILGPHDAVEQPRPAG
jgi:hypothetical protein